MFPCYTYIERRERLRKKIPSGLLLFLGNRESPYNYRSNTYVFRQDSCFSYLFGLNEPNLAAIMDVDEGVDYLFGDEIDMEDIIWMGTLPSLQRRATCGGISKTNALKNLPDFIKKARDAGRQIHFLPPYRHEVFCDLEDLLGIPRAKIVESSSLPLKKAMIELRSVKDELEIAEIEKMVDVAWLMHVHAMEMAIPGIVEREISGAIEGIALSNGNGVSFPVILTTNGQTLHNHSHDNFLQKGRLMLTDAGAESEMLYASDITRTIPVSGSFTPAQRDIYNIVLAANLKTVELTNPKTPYRDVHIAISKIIAAGLKNLGFMKGNVEDAVEAGAHALFFPHGLGHMLGMDVHDMEGLGEDLVGYDETIKRSDQFGLAYLRFAKKPEPGYVLTNEPGIYFIPELINLWQSEKKFTEFINYDKALSFKTFGGIRIEDDILVTENGCHVLGRPIPKTVEEIEETMKYNKE